MRRARTRQPGHRRGFTSLLPLLLMLLRTTPSPMPALRCRNGATNPRLRWANPSRLPRRRVRTPPPISIRQPFRRKRRLLPQRRPIGTCPHHHPPRHPQRRPIGTCPHHPQRHHPQRQPIGTCPHHPQHRHPQRRPIGTCPHHPQHHHPQRRPMSPCPSRPQHSHPQPSTRPPHSVWRPAVKVPRPRRLSTATRRRRRRRRPRRRKPCLRPSCTKTRPRRLRWRKSHPPDRSATWRTGFTVRPPASRRRPGAEASPDRPSRQDL